MTVFTATPTAAALTTLLTLEAKSTSPVSNPFIAMSEDITTSLASMPSSLKYPKYFANNNGAADISLEEDREKTAGFRVWPKASRQRQVRMSNAASRTSKTRAKFINALGLDFIN